MCRFRRKPSSLRCAWAKNKQKIRLIRRGGGPGLRTSVLPFARLSWSNRFKRRAFARRFRSGAPLDDRSISDQIQLEDRIEAAESKGEQGWLRMAS
jgi:hypothetical protein